MTPLTPEAWAQIRFDYEQTEKPIGDICAEHGISSGTLRDRMRRWDWTRRRLPIDQYGPPPAPLPEVWTPPEQEFEPATPPSLPATPIASVATPAPAAWPVMAGDGASASFDSDDRPIAERLQGAIARMLPAIESNVARLCMNPAHPRETAQAVRSLVSLTRTLREVSGLLARHQTEPAGERERTPEEMDAFRNELAWKIGALVDERTGVTASGEPVRPPQEG